MTQQYCLASLAAWLSSTSISHHNLPPPSHSLGLSLYNQWQPSPWDCSTIPMLQLPAAAPSRGPESLSGVCMAMARIACIILVPFTLSQISSFTISLKCFFSVSNNCLDEGIGPLLQFPHPPRAGPVLLMLLFFPLVPTEFCMGLYILFLWSGTPVLSQLVFCMYFCVWRCISGVSMERVVLHIHLLLRHLVLLSHFSLQLLVVFFSLSRSSLNAKKIFCGVSCNYFFLVVIYLLTLFMITLPWRSFLKNVVTLTCTFYGFMVSCSPWGCKESNMTERLMLSLWLYGFRMFLF